jgi:hypothetical protein
LKPIVAVLRRVVGIEGAKARLYGNFSSGGNGCHQRGELFPLRRDQSNQRVFAVELGREPGISLPSDKMLLRLGGLSETIED